MPPLRDGLPELYRTLLPAFFAESVPEERKATCGSCAMCPGGVDAVEPVDGVDRQFRPDAKCCTFHPRLPNYLVGALLADERPALAEGRRRIEEKLAARVGLTPQWLRPPGKHRLLYDNVRHAFGRSLLLLCPFFERSEGTCTIWAHREAVCSTFFCRHVAGADGQRFWMALKSYLALCEQQLSRWALLELAPAFVLEADPAADGPGGPLSAEELEDRAPTPAAYAALWRDWAGRERALYLACFERVRALDAATFEAILGLDGRVALERLRAARDAAVSPRVPARLRFNPATTVKWLPDGTVALGAYSDLEALALPAAAYPLLLEFTGQDPVDAVRGRLRARHGLDLDDDALLSLHQHRILVAP
jgi:Fe-S-cluster containining protein